MIGLGLQTEAEGSEQAILSSSEVLEINIDEACTVDLWVQALRRDIRCCTTVLDRVCEDAARSISGMK